MADVAMLIGVLPCCIVGFAWLALAMDAHWQQVFDAKPRSNGDRARLRTLGSIALVVSLCLALAVDHGSIAALVWIMTLASAALVVAFTLAWRPRLLVVVVPWLIQLGKSRTT